MEKSKIPSLDGARAFSIFLVLVAHLALVETIPYSAEIHATDIGNFGVRIFFVISGFLITTLLLQEYARNGSISLRNFYVRRAFRIFPALYVFLLVTTVLGLLGQTSIDIAHLPFVAASFLSNYAEGQRIWDHTWSLSVEEQFYLLWPFILVLGGWRFGFKLLVAALLLSPLFRVAIDNGYWPGSIARSFEANADALAAGCALAVFRDRLMQIRLYAGLVNSPFLPLFAVATLLITRLTIHDTLVWDLLKNTTYNGLIMMVLDRYMRHPGTIVGAIMNWKPVAYVGTISYSLYLWQQLAMFNTWNLSWLEQIVFSFAAAIASYYLVEKPFLRLRKRFEVAPAALQRDVQAAFQER
ncbi:acyltransferase family protein [Steroidobacter cummioxidans]|uniref:acyltransferase family protein n=1 Tax=Steroidobacter cummioxidans TaxID=1803913 RepID=UPI000E31AC5B|nr:acyltransferase [Steroidobacter cummioxidans]